VPRGAHADVLVAEHLRILEEGVQPCRWAAALAEVFSISWADGNPSSLRCSETDD